MSHAIKILLLGFIALIPRESLCQEYENHIMTEVIREVLKDESMVNQLSANGELLIRVSKKLGNLQLTEVDGQKVRIVRERELKQMARQNTDSVRPFLYVQLDGKGDKLAITASYSCMHFLKLKSGKLITMRDHFCRGGMVFNYKFREDKWVGVISSKI